MLRADSNEASGLYEVAVAAMKDTLLTPRGRILIFIMLEGPVTRLMLEERANLSDRSVERALGVLHRDGLIAWEKLRPNGPRWWSVKPGMEVAEVLLEDAQP